jgi:hypothetical protein
MDKRRIMCSYNIVLDDQLVAKAEQSLRVKKLDLWLQQQVEALVRDACRANKVFIRDGEVEMQLTTDTLELEEARQLLHKMVDLEYSLL